MEKTEIIRDLTKGSAVRLLIGFSVPFVLANLLQTLYGVADMVIVGQFVGSVGLSAVGIGSDLLSIVTLLCTGFATAGQIMISQYVGKNDRAGISRTIGTMFTLLLLAALVITVICCALASPLLRLVRTPEEAREQAMAYTATCFPGLIFIFGYNIVSAVLRGMGDGRRPLLFAAVAASLNIVPDLLFVGVFRLAAFGSALATVMAQAVSFLVSVFYLYRRRESFAFDFHLRSFAVHRVQAAALCKMGFPMALQFGAISVTMMFVNSLINGFGLTISAVNSVGNKLPSLSTVVVQSVGTASTTMCGQNLAAHRYDRVSRIVHISLLINVVYTAVLCLVLMMFPRQVFRLFTLDAEVLEWAAVFMPVMAVNFACSALMSPYNALINGLGYASLSLVISLLDGVAARIPEPGPWRGVRRPGILVWERSGRYCHSRARCRILLFRQMAQTKTACG